MSKKEVLILKKKSITFIALFAVVVGFLHVANIFAAFSASNVLGQVSGGGGPVYDSGGANNSITDFYGQFAALNPSGSTYDPVNEIIFTSDTSGNRVLAFQANSDGTPQDYFADYVIGQQNFTTSSAGLSDAELSGPTDLEIDESQRLLFVSDTGNNRILVFDINSLSNGMSASYVIGQPDFVTNTAGAGADDFTSQTGMGMDQTNHVLYVADTGNNRVKAIEVTLADIGLVLRFYGQPDGVSNSPATSISGLSTPMDVGFISPNRIAVADFLNNRVLIFPDHSTAAGNGPDALSVLGQPDFDTANFDCLYGSDVFCGPTSLDYHVATNTLYISDSLHNRVVGYTSLASQSNGTVVIGHSDFTGASGSMTFSGSIGNISITDDDSVLNMIVADPAGYRFVLFDEKNRTNDPSIGDVLGQVVNGTSDLVGVNIYSPFNNQITAQGFSFVNVQGDIAIDTEGHRLFAADPGNNRVLVYNLNSSNVPIDRTADYVLGQPDFNSNSYGLTQGGLNEPKGLAYHENEDRTLKLLFVADSENDRVVVYDVMNIANGEDAAHVLGQVDFISTDLTTISNPMGLSVDSVHNDLYVAGGNEETLVVYDISSIVDGEDPVIDMSIPSSGGMVSDVEYFTDSSNHSSYLAISTKLGVKLWYTSYDTENSFSASSLVGTLGHSGGDTPLLLDNTYSSTLTYSSGSEILYVTDAGHHRVLGYDMTDLVTSQVDPGDLPVSVFGQDDYLSSSPDTSQSALVLPQGVVIDPVNNRLWVSDSGNNRVLSFDIIRITSSSYPTSVEVTAKQGSVFEVLGISNPLPPGLNGAFPISSASTSVIYQRGIPLVYNRTFSYLITQVRDTLSAGVSFYSNKNYQTSGSSVRSGQVIPDSLSGGYVATNTYQSTLQYAVDYAIDTNNHKLYALTNTESVANVVNHEIWTYDLNSDNSFLTSTASTRFGDFDLDPQTNTVDQYNIAYGTSIAFDSVSNQLFVADAMNNRVLVYSTSSTPTNNTPAQYVLGQANFNSNTALTTQSGMRYPAGLVVDESRRKLFVSDSGNNRVLVFDIATISNGENAQYVIGQDDFVTRTYDFTANDKMTVPTDLEFDQSTKELFVNNRAQISTGGRIQKFDTSSLANGLSLSDEYTAESISNEVSHFNSIAYDSETKRVFAGINMSGVDLVLILNNSLDFPILVDDNTFDVDSGAGWIGASFQNKFGITSSPGDNDSSHFSTPYLTFDSSNRTLYLADTENAKTMVFDFVRITTTSLASGDVGVAYTDAISSENYQGTVTYSVASGSLPTGLTLNSSTGELSGTPTVAGTYTFTVDANDRISGKTPNFSDQQQYSVLVTQATPPSQCDDSIDNDGDGLTDYPSDPGCTSDVDDDETNTNTGGSPSACSDDLDNDGDGLVDFPDDPGCVNSSDSSEVNTTPTYQCSDSIDNDGDGFVDYPNDSGCASLSDNSESNTIYSCADGIDNDGDGLTDYPSDPGCFYLTDNDETDTLTPTVFICSDGIDNDGDGLTDYPSDAGCSSATDSSEYNVVVTPPVDTPVDDTPIDTGGDTPEIIPPTEEPIETPQDVPEETEVTPENDEPQVLSGGDGCFREITSETPFAEVVIIQVRGTLCEVQNTIEDTGGYIGQVLTSTENGLAKIIAIVGLVMGALFTVVPYLFLTPFSFSEVALLPYRLWSLLMSVLGLKKQVRPWGTVYDAITKQPLDPAVVELLDLEGRPVATSTTDIDGRYGFLVGPGKYRLLPKKTHYAFPSLKMIGKTRDELYLDLYFGYVFEITKEGEVITKNIPMDPENFDWNEFAKNQQKRMRFYSKRDFVFNKIADFLFSIGFTVSIVALISAPVIYNIIIFSLYVVILVLREIGIKYSSFGKVKDKEGNPLSFAIVRVKLGDGTEISQKVTNATGLFYCLLQNGTYIVSVEKKNIDESYTKVYEQVHVIKKGVLKGEIKV